VTSSSEPSSHPDASLSDPDGAPLAVAVGRSIGGILLVLAGAAIILGAIFLLFVAPFLGPAWDVWSYFTDYFWVPVAIGIGILLWGVTLVRRARKQRLEEPVDLSMIASTPPEA
jgi:hypothetical protein